MKTHYFLVWKLCICVFLRETEHTRRNLKSKITSLFPTSFFNITTFLISATSKFPKFDVEIFVTKRRDLHIFTSEFSFLNVEFFPLLRRILVERTSDFYFFYVEYFDVKRRDLIFTASSLCS